MHRGSVPESTGRMGESKPLEVACPRCKGGPCTVRVWESHCGVFEDEKCTCSACGHVWWYEGIDS